MKHLGESKKSSFSHAVLLAIFLFKSCIRAFSVFLFDSDGYLLLQKRALDKVGDVRLHHLLFLPFSSFEGFIDLKINFSFAKITFPGVWTNTCCSHQLTGYVTYPCPV